MTDRNPVPPDAFECVEPELREQLWRRRDPDADPRLRSRLEDHLTVCDACRLTVMIEDRIEAGVRSGELDLGTPAAGRPFGGPLAWGGALALAASLAVMLILPPTARQVPGVVRGDGDLAPRFVRPVEGEVLVTASPRLRWRPIPEATAYRVEVSQVDGPWSWSGRADRAEITLPAEAALPAGSDFRAVVEPVPADLAGLADVTVSFRRAGPVPFLIYRLQAAPPGAWLTGLLGLVLLGWSLVPRRSPSHQE